MSVPRLTLAAGAFAIGLGLALATGTGGDARVDSRAGEVRADAGEPIRRSARVETAGDGSLRHGMAAPPGVHAYLGLRDVSGRSLSSHLEDGRRVLLTWVFSACSSTCPVSLDLGRRLLERLPAADAPTLAFVNLDPYSEDPAGFARWLAAYDGRFLGLNATPDELRAALGRMGVAVRGESGALEHSAVWYLIEPDGSIARVYPFATPLDALVDDLGGALLRVSDAR